MDAIPLASPQLADAGLAAEPGTTGDAAMSALEEGSVALDPPSVLGPLPRAAAEPTGAIRVQGKFFFAGGTKHFVKGVTYGPFAIRWHGAQAVRRFLKELVGIVRDAHPGALVSYANFPSTEYLTVEFTDFLCFNVYLHDETAFRRYIARLHNLAVDKPLVLTEFGVDSMRLGEEEQRQILSWQGRPAFAAGAAGTFVFAWTDEWFTGGHLIEDWAFGLVDRERQPKPAWHAVAARYKGPLPPSLARYPRVSVVV